MMGATAFLNPLTDPVEFARLTLINVLIWGIPFFAFECLFEWYTARLEKWGYLERHAPMPTVPKAEMLRQSVVAIAGVALPGCLALALLRPTWQYDVSIFGAVAMVPFVFAHSLVFDTWFYWVHRLAHSVPWIYRLVHKLHHAPAACLTSGSSAYMSFLEGALMVGTPFVPIVLCAVYWFDCNVWTLAVPVYTIVSAVSLGHVGGYVKKSWLPILAISPYMVAMAITHASRPEDHSAHHERVVVNFATLFRFWDDWCGTAPAPGLKSTRGWGVAAHKKDGAADKQQQQQGQVRAKDVPIGLRVSLYNAFNSFAFLGVLLLATGAPAFFAAALALALLLPASVRFEAACFRALGLTRLVTRRGFWDGLRRDLRVTVEREEQQQQQQRGPSSPSWSSSSSQPAAAGEEAEGDEAPVVAAARRTSPRLLEKRAAALEAAVADSFAQQQQQQQPRASSMSPPATPQPSGRRAAPRARGGAWASTTTTTTATTTASAAASSLAPHTPKLYVYHPRGDLMRGAFFAFGPRGCDPTHPLAAERDVRLALPPAAARVLLRLPLLRELIALLGGVHPASVTAALKSGASVAVCLPGPPVRGPPRPAVSADAAPAFIDAALASNAALVPVVAVGEQELAGRLPLQDKIVMPLRPGCAVRVVVGEPVVAGAGESAQALRARFARELAALAARHGAPPPELADV